MRSGFHRAVGVSLSLILLVAAVVIPAGPAAAASGDKRPNLQMLELHDWRIQTVDGRRLLRFTTIFANAGPGHFELRGSRSSRSDRTMDVDQLMYRWDGTRRRIDTPAIARYSGDGHDHWHVQGVVVYEAWKEADPLLTRRGAKTGFCFFDTTAWKTSIRGARKAPYYQEAWCGTKASLANRTGLSVGWGDRYPWHFAYQWIDITGLPGGIYRVRATVDIHDYYDERIETDNCTWTKIRIPAPGSTRQPTVYASGNDCGVDAITPVTSFPSGVTWDPAKAVRILPGTYPGYRFNSQGTVLRSIRKSLTNERIVYASARAIVPGRTGRYLYIETGPFAGYWVKQGNGVTLVR